jgi:xylose dehydrogenase (NAD/NADP)
VTPTADSPVGFGVLGGRSFVATAAVIPAIEESSWARLVAVGSRGGLVSYDDVLADPDVDVVYLPLPNGMHAEWTERAAAAGKHVLCEKPLASTADEAEQMVSVCRAAGVRLFEAWMTPFSPPWATAIDEARACQVDRIDTRFTFTIEPGNDHNYRWDPAQGGGALLDVGIYVLGPAVALWGPEPERVEATSHTTPRGVDVTTEMELKWSGNRICRSLVSFELPEAQELRLRGTDCDLRLDGDAHTGVAGTYRRMVEAVAHDIRDITTHPRPIEDAVAMLRLIDRIRTAAEHG